MHQGTTPTIPLTFRNTDLSNAKIFLTIQDENKRKQLTLISGEHFTVSYDGTNTVGTVRLTQEQTLSLVPGECEIQARFVYPDGSAGVTDKLTVRMHPVLLRGVISYD